MAILQSFSGGFRTRNAFKRKLNDVGAKHSGDYLSGNPEYLFPNASPCLYVTSGKGEAFGYKNLGQVAKLIARMLRPYIINQVLSFIRECDRTS
jgi:hypothetical protein